MQVKISKILPAYGYLTMALFVVCALSGVLLSLVYTPAEAYKSIALMLLQNPYAALIRSVHYWSAQMFLIMSIVHIFDHLLKIKELKLKSSIWLRTVLIIPLIIYVMLTGFFLRGDAESTQAINIFRTITQSVPVIGSALSYILTGFGDSLQTIFIHHIVTTTVLIWLFSAEHSKVIYSTTKSYFWVLPVVVVLSLFFVPLIHLSQELIIKSPWYFIGLQEFLHNVNVPVATILIFLLVIAIIYYLPFFNKARKKTASIVLAVLLVSYLILSVTGVMFRGKNWTFGYDYHNIASQFNFFGIGEYFGIDDSLAGKPIAIVNGKPEGCLSCHTNVKGFSVSHSPDSIGCSSCHSGNPLTLNKQAAHKGMILMSGNLSNAEKTCGQAGCHTGLQSRVANNIMNTMSGVISVDKWAFGEIHNLDTLLSVNDVAHSPADKHLRNLCIGCHIGAAKDSPGKITELSRGGGCLACHIKYSDEAEKELIKRTADRSRLIKYHPSVSLNVGNDACFGCHSRSGRISTNYEGWHETLMSKEDYERNSEKSNLRLLEDGRVFRKVSPDVHYKSGLDCIDCHGSYELMGDGIMRPHKEDHVKIECEDCHLTKKPKTLTYNRMDTESQKIIKLRNLFQPGRKYVAQSRSGLPLINVYMNRGRPVMRSKNGDSLYALKPPSEVCGKDIDGHGNLSCQSCHTRAVPQCIGCHTEYNPDEAGWDNLLQKQVQGGWHETGSDFLFDQPALGVVTKHTADGKPYEQITTFMPGMIMTLKKNKHANSVFRRLYAPAFSHTIVSDALDCKSCHNNPQALGYGRGKLIYKVNGKRAKWEFKPQYARSRYDNLPLDAWIPFLKKPPENITTRSFAGPLSLNKQKKILTVGACFECHSQNDAKLLSVFRKYKDYKSKISRNCILPFVDSE